MFHARALDASEQFRDKAVGTIRLKLLKLGTVILRNTRRIRLLFSSAYPNRELFGLVARRLETG